MRINPNVVVIILVEIDELSKDKEPEYKDEKNVMTELSKKRSAMAAKKIKRFKTRTNKEEQDVPIATKPPSIEYKANPEMKSSDVNTDFNSIVDPSQFEKPVTIDNLPGIVPSDIQLNV